MTYLDKTFHSLMYLALFCLAGGIFASTSLLGVYISAFSLATLLFYIKNPRSIKDLPRSAYLLLAMALIGIISFGLNFHETDDPFDMLGKLKYFIMAAIGIPPLKYFLKNISPKTSRFYIYVFILSIVVASIYGFIGALNGNQIGDHVFEGLGNRSGGLTDIMRFSYGLALVFPICLSVIISKAYRSEYLPSVKWFYLVLVFCVFGVLTAQSRGAMLGVLLAIPLCLFFYKKKIAILVFLMSLVTLSSFVYLVETSDSTSTRSFFSRVFQKLESRSGLLRITQFKAAAYAVKEKPIFGHGMERFKPQVERIKDQYNLPYKDFIDQHSHNVFLELAAHLGLAGFLCFLGWFLYWGLDSYKTNYFVTFFPFAIVFIVIGQLEQIFLTNNMILTYAFYQLCQVDDIRKNL